MDGNSRKRSAEDSMVEDMPVEEIRAIVQDIANSNGSVKDKERVFKAKYSYFVERYPMLFKMVCTPNFDMARLEQIFAMMANVRSNDMSYDDASKQFGQQMFDTYIKPNLGKLKKNNGH